jgi:ADP-ribose pyrophosphatase YjhB (NUDIX family)
MAKQADIRKAGVVIIQSRHFLVSRSWGKDMFVAPGGKLEPGESYEQAARRELNEEQGIDINESELSELGTFHAPAAGNEEKLLEMKVFLVNRTIGELTPQSEIEENRWINTQTQGVPLGSIFEHDVMPMLKQKDLID